MKNDYTHISIILDRTGSMESIREDTIGGFNTFLVDQKAQSGMATLTLVQFDSQDPYEVIHRFKPIAEVPELTRETFVPRGSTPLLDALGRGINDLDECLARLIEEERPSRVILVVVTDGHENSSKEFTKSDVEKMVKDRTENSGWQFVFLSADLAAIDEARDLMIPHDSSLYYAKSGKGSASAWASLSSRSSAYRSARSRKVGFAPEDREKANDSDKQ